MSRRSFIEPSRICAKSGIGVGPRAAQRGGDEKQQHQVAGRVADGEPQAVLPGDHDQPGNAQEAAAERYSPPMALAFHQG